MSCCWLMYQISVHACDSGELIGAGIIEARSPGEARLDAEAMLQRKVDVVAEVLPRNAEYPLALVGRIVPAAEFERLAEAVAEAMPA